MKLVVSNIAWTNSEEPEIAKLLESQGVKYIEIAPTKFWENPGSINPEDISRYIKFWRKHGIEIVAFQSMLFNRPDLKIFESKSIRQDTINYLKEYIQLAEKFNINAMVFGSPKNRQRGNYTIDQAEKIAIPFFRELGDLAKLVDLYFCIEPNATQYNCDFITNAKEGLNFVKEIDSTGVGLHLDTGCMSLAGDDFTKSIIDSKKILKHFHISSPMLEQVEFRDDTDHRAASLALKEIDYSGFVSIEMRPAKEGENMKRVKRAIEFAQETYIS